MKKIINGKLYDTECESHTIVAIVNSEWKSPEIYGPPTPMFKMLTLYKTENGNFFFEICKGMGKNLPNESDIYPTTAQHAMRWCIDNEGDIEEEFDFNLFENAFPNA